jgi:hypothetical protein
MLFLSLVKKKLFLWGFLNTTFKSFYFLRKLNLLFFWGNMILSISFELDNIQLVIVKEYFCLFTFRMDKNTTPL